MKAVITLTVLGLAAGWATFVAAQSEESNQRKKMENCAVCKYLADKPELMKKMTWETHKIDGGMMSVASVPKEDKDEFAAVQKKMMQAIAQVKADQQQGKSVELCDYCESMGDLMKAGAKEENIDTATGAICLVTSKDPAVVEKIHTAADKAIAEQKKMEQSQASR